MNNTNTTMNNTTINTNPTQFATLYGISSPVGEMEMRQLIFSTSVGLIREFNERINIFANTLMFSELIREMIATMSPRKLFKLLSSIKLEVEMVARAGDSYDTLSNGNIETKQYKSDKYQLVSISYDRDEFEKLLNA